MLPVREAYDTPFMFPPRQQSYPTQNQLPFTLDRIAQPVGDLHRRSTISDAEYHAPNSRMRSSTAEDIDSKSSARGKYRCGLCGQLKANHNCPYLVEVPTRSISTQSDPPIADINVPTSHPFFSGDLIFCFLH